MKVIIFLICILVIQQIDGNIIAPKILGENTGVSSLCVLVSIIIMGDLWGLVGMLVGVPLFATVIELVKLYLDQRLREKGMPGHAQDFDAQDAAKEPEKVRKKIRRQKRLAPGGSGDLSPLEQIQLRTYALARKYRIFTDHSDEALNEFAAEAAAVFAAVAAEEEAKESSAANAPEAAATEAGAASAADSEAADETGGDRSDGTVDPAQTEGGTRT